MNPTIAIVGLGYVGLPLAAAFGKRYRTVGYDSCESKIAHYTQYHDPSGEVESGQLRAANLLSFTATPAPLGEADIIIIAVPTPVDIAHIPDFGPLIAASVTVGRHMKAGATVVYESTVYPGATEEVCIPILERESGLKWKKDFHVGYSPERVNPGDKERTITKVVKVVSGDDDTTLELLSSLYGSIIIAGIHRTPSIKVAEAAKVIENTQRDLNVALMNELAILFNKMDIDTTEVLQAAGTKWNFLPFRPGLVGGHCIGVDPYYLTHKAQMLGYLPQVILAGRRINDGMAKYVVEQTVKRMIHAGSTIKGARVIVLGLTFKENCPDLRNSGAAKLVAELREFGCDVTVHDPVADPAEAKQEYGITLSAWPELPEKVDAIVAAVSHRDYLAMPICDLLSKLRAGGVFSDVKSAYDPEAIRAGGAALWRL